MNKTLRALMTKLEWQLSELAEQLLSIEHQLTNLAAQYDETLQKILNASTTPAFILPEKEMARLNFMMVQQLQLDEQHAQKTQLQSQQETLRSRQVRLNIELKMLEKHQETQAKNKQQQIRLNQQKNTDEWVLQQRGTL